MLKFITGNATKFKEVSELLKPLCIEQIDIDLHEIQELDIREILKQKLREAFRHYQGKFLVEDSALYLDCLNGKLPGPFIKWFNQSLGPVGVYHLAKKQGNFRAKAQTLVAYAESSERIKFFQGTLKGKIVEPRGAYRFGYDQIFQPQGFSQTQSQTKARGDFTKSPRGIAMRKLKKFLLTRNIS